MQRLWRLCTKEYQLIAKDPQGLLLLFFMPSFFILIMTFALQNQFRVDARVQVEYVVVDRDGEEESGWLLDQLAAMEGLKPVFPTGDESVLRGLASGDEVEFLLRIPENFTQHIADMETAVEIEFAPSTAPAIATAVESHIRILLARLSLQQHLEGMSVDVLSPEVSSGLDDLISVTSLYRDNADFPSSVQQNVPAWLLFAMFFIAIPLSTTMINERQQGTDRRLRTMGISTGVQLAGKFLPYFSINLVQAGLMLLIGIFLVPLLGGERLHFGSHSHALLLIIAAASVAAVSYALFVAQVSRTVQQATIFSAVFNIIMAAVGGVMVPRFVMPASMQELSEFSPMAWGLDGFFDILLRDGGFMEVFPESLKLLGFALGMLCLTFLITKFRRTELR